jgi:hypothetical protein
MSNSFVQRFVKLNVKLHYPLRWITAFQVQIQATGPAFYQVLFPVSNLGCILALHRVLSQYHRLILLHSKNVVDVKILSSFVSKVIPLKPVIHTSQRNQSRDVKSINLVPERKSDSFVPRHVMENVNCHVVNATILYSFVLKVMPLKPVINTLQNDQSEDVESINLVPERKLNSFVPRHVKENVSCHQRLMHRTILLLTHR